jgi:P27 family predicted phage terminase small subunit
MARPRILTQLKVLKGTAQRSRMNLQEPKPDTGVPEMPEGLDEEHQKSWAQHAKLLTGMKVLTVADGLALESMVRAHVELRRLQAEVAQLSAVERTDSGLLKRHPGISAVADYDRRYLSWLTKFGLTPADRSRVSAVVDAGVENPWAKVLKGS